MNIDELVERMLAFEPHDLAGRFSTTFADGTTGEQGVFLFVDKDRWAVRIDGAATLWSTGARRFSSDHAGTSSSTSLRPPERPPWSLVLPRLAHVYGRPGDDWELAEIVTGDDREVTVSLVSGTEQGRLRVELDPGTIVELVTPSWTATAQVGLDADERLQLAALLGG
ncbi:hypothetical protein Cch01nite_44750 [Cellulomonas chitinilytica]|uniref:Uncharacterized protein n=1 Tax=Cellulomonas chitinilytica TaxID=398759 RepID=A0A919U3Y8_9CELL|nr:hypothetical protein [Cellulomonas chitinilytica]GIG23751.1 hypothetical protein Cch01nite_44750 [Cellulomonas chitinilytica]